jgi:protein OS-9
LGVKCLQKNDGWWRYELCHTKNVRQYHPGTRIDPASGDAIMVVETEHLLGVYNGTGTVLSVSSSSSTKGSSNDKSKKDEDSYPDLDEIKHMENPKSSIAAFVVEYVNGDMCDNSEDVKDESLKRIARATTVKFSCGKAYELKRVNEDSTCHYVFHVSVPELCRHPLFVAPVVKEQVVKCLPVVNDMLLEFE